MCEKIANCGVYTVTKRLSIVITVTTPLILKLIFTVILMCL